MRWIFGKDYDPFATTVKEGLHPLPAFMKHHENKIRNFYLGSIYIVPTFVFVTMIHSVLKIAYKRVYELIKK